MVGGLARFGKDHPICHFHGGGMVVKEEQGAEEGSEDVRCNVVKGFPDIVRDGIRPWGRGG